MCLMNLYLESENVYLAIALYYINMYKGVIKYEYQFNKLSYIIDQIEMFNISRHAIKYSLNT